jgi:hypothetical protein
LLKLGIVSGVSYLFYENLQYVKKYEGVDTFAEKETFYISPIFRLARFTRQCFEDAYHYIRYPPLKKFLPDEAPFNKALLRKTLVLNFEGTMYSKDHKAGDGLVVHLRPGFRKLLKELGQKYEIVIFSKEDTNFLSDVIKTIDPY